MRTLTNKIAVVTGGSDGIGLAAAVEFARRGMRLVLLARDASRLANAAQTIRVRVRGAKALAMPCDVTDERRVGETFAAIRDAEGGVDVLVNCAGVSVYGPADETPMDAIRRVMEVNYFGALNCTFAALPMMRARGGGQIVNISSAAGLHGVPYLAAYGAAKSALANFSQALRAELAPCGIVVSVVYPGHTRTGIFDKERVYGDVHRPAGPYMPVEKVARAIADAIRKRRPEVVIGREGKALSLGTRFFPRATRRLLGLLAGRLKGSAR